TEIGDSANLAHLITNLLGDLRYILEIGAYNFYRIRAFNSRDSLLHVVLDVLREIEIDSRQFVAKFRLNLISQLFLRHASRPFVKWFQRCEELHVREWRGV